MNQTSSNEANGLDTSVSHHNEVIDLQETEIIKEGSNNSNTGIKRQKRSRKQSTPTRYPRRKMTPKKDLHPLPGEMSEEENSLSSPPANPLSPPTNNKRIDSYFTPKEVMRTDSKSSVSRALFSKVIPETQSSQGMDVLETPPQSLEITNNKSLPSHSRETTFQTSSCHTMLDQRYMDVHNLLMCKDSRIKELEQELTTMKNQLSGYNEMCNSIESQQEEFSKLQGEYKQMNDLLQSQVAQLTKESQENREKGSKALQMWISRYATLLSMERHENLIKDNVRLGTVVLQQHGHNVVEVWREGERYKQLKRKISELTEVKEKVESERRSLRRKLTRVEKETIMCPPAQSISGQVTGEGEEEESTDFDQLVKQEIVKCRLNSVKKQLQEYQDEITKLDREKEDHIRESRRIRDEHNSKYNERPLLQGRYQIIELLGKGGFSEVWHAFDIITLTDVAIKFHQLSSNWSDERKNNFIKHAIRENDIQKRLCHENVVRQLDSFAVDGDCFVTVLEYCPGIDLERYLKQNVYLKEAEARAIVIQLLSALKYMSTLKTKIIHYDLKPGNILFDAYGHVKITDFGLSKEMDPSGDSKMPLTSQGAGTYWYLPPECFLTAKDQPPFISQKVDVWSVGIILYQMVYGKKPFGEDMSQETLLRENVILNITSIEFPAKPVVSAECKDFIVCCLQKDVQRRWSIADLCEHNFITQKK